MIYGFHFSIGGKESYLTALREAEAFGVNAVQIFAKSPRAWRKKALPIALAERFRAARELLGIQSLVIHASYLVNLGAEGELFEKSVHSLADDLEKARLLGAEAVVVHPGSGEIPRIREGLSAAAKRAPSPAKLLVENTVGGGKKRGATPEELADLARDTPFGLVLDTAHAWAMGYRPVEFLDELERLGLLPRLALVHFNDARHERGSRRDVHASLGAGTMGEALRELLMDARVRPLPFIMETPKADDPKNLATFKAWLVACGL